MSLSADTLLDRIRLKSQLKAWRGLALTLSVVLGLVLFIQLTGEMPGTKYVARITVEGIIEEDQYQTKVLKELSEDDKVEAVIVHINSPGGTSVGGENLYHDLQELAEKKPVVSVMGTLATSAAYMASLPAHRVFAREGSITGSVGVLLQSAEVVELAKKLGVDMTVIKSSPLKAVPSPFEKLTPEGKESIQNVIDDFYRVFVDMIVKSRKLPREKVLEFADGRIFTGRQALELKMIDAIGGEKEAIAWLETNKQVEKDLNVRDVDTKKPKNEGLEGILGSFFPYKKLIDGFSLEGLLSVWQDGIVLNH